MYFICALFYVLFLISVYVDGSCRTSNGNPICCEGKKSHCYGYTYTNQTSIEQVRIQSRFKLASHPIRAVKLKKCFCDNSCTLTGDCCPDYREICQKPITNCIVSDWGEWSMCSEKCKKGIQIRKRSIITQERNGGKPCPVLVETKECQLWNCRNKRIGRSHRNQLMRLTPSKEVAYLMPARRDIIEVLRKHDIRWDVRRKLYYGRLIQQNKTEQPDPDPYCVTYQITFASEGCRRIYTNPQLYDRYDRNIQRRVLPAAWVSHGHLLRSNFNVCVTCYPAYMKKALGNRCLGTGIEMIETRWRGVGTPDCHGRFKMVRSPRQNCSCNSLASFLFV